MKKGLATVLIAVTLLLYSFTGVTKQKHRLSFQGAPSTQEQLGEMLFFETSLSLTRELSCASCHKPEHGFADTGVVSRGIYGRKGKRNTPSCMNMGGRPYLFYDGRAATLEEQVRFPIEDKNEMGLPINEAVNRLKNNKAYLKYFELIYHSKPNEKNLTAAIAAYERTLETGDTPFDSYMDDDSAAISASAARGRNIFMGPKAKCFECHFTGDFTGDEFRSIGLYDSVHYTDKGRAAITGNNNDLGKFKVPGLRNVAVTGPYMHNGMFRTLRQVIDYYDDPYKVIPNPLNIDTLLRAPLHLTEEEKTDLEQFMISLTDKRFAGK